MKYQTNIPQHVWNTKHYLFHRELNNNMNNNKSNVKHDSLLLEPTVFTLLKFLESASVAQLDAPSDWRPGGRGFNPRRGR